MKAQLLAAWNRVRTAIGLPVMIVIFVVGSYFVYTFIRDWQTRNAIERQNARIDEYGRQSAESIAETNRHLASFAANNLATMALLDTIKAMSGNIERLAENDQTVTIRVADLEKNYESTRNKKSGAVVKSRVPLREREDSVLAADRELYK